MTKRHMHKIKTNRPEGIDPRSPYRGLKVFWKKLRPPDPEPKPEGVKTPPAGGQA